MPEWIKANRTDLGPAIENQILDRNLLQRNQATTPEGIVASGLDEHKIALDLLQLSPQMRCES